MEKVDFIETVIQAKLLQIFWNYGQKEAMPGVLEKYQGDQCRWAE